MAFRMTRNNLPLPLGSTIGILGGGQLGRMSAMAAERLGYRPHIYSVEQDSPGAQVAADVTYGAFDDIEAVAAFAAKVDVLTFEFENIPRATLEYLATLPHCRPNIDAILICQDRIAEKTWMETSSITVAEWLQVSSLADIDTACAKLGFPFVLKTTRMGYDGKGQAVARSREDAIAAFEHLAPHPLIAEAFVPFEREISIVLARGVGGELAIYEPVENIHQHHILHQSILPARLSVEQTNICTDYAARLAEALGFVGVMALEMFALPDGRILGNEIAPRPHNSGHWTMDACPCSQFDQHIRAVAGLPLGTTERHFDVVMHNLVGTEGFNAWSPLLAQKNVVPHWYGKAEVRKGRKLGHANELWAKGTMR